MTDKDYDKLKQIEESIQAFDTEKLYESSIALYKTLGYQSNKTERITPNNFDGFTDSFNLSKNSINKEKALVDQWKRIEFIFQVADSEITRIQSLFDTREVDKNEYQSFLFFTIQLKEDSYKRGDLVKITRELNVPFNMPVIVLFQYANKLTLSIIDRRLNKRDTSKDVLEKVTLIKDIDIANPQRAHKEILKDLSLNELYKQFEFHSFVKLHEAWKSTLNISELNKKFYKELAYWYFWALQEVKFPADELKDDKTRNPVNVIRLITRLIFVWFLKEKNLVPDDLFNKRELDKILDYKDKTGSTYYKAILQNLFFATLNTEMNKDVKDKNKISRTFVARNTGVPHYFRYGRLIKDQDKFSALMDNIPFLNGGLFECLDKRFKDNSKDIFIDGFTQQVKNEDIVIVPDYLFFNDAPRNIDLNNTFHTKGKKYEVHGLIDILSRYKFTIEENTPIEEEVALDPELLGKVFENLLASYNEETETTARKLTGSFYTPREIVNYMVDESLITYLKSAVSFQLADDSTTSFQLADENIDYSPFFEFDPNNEIIIKEGNLPHWTQENVWYFITFRLADSIPSEMVDQLKHEREIWLSKHKNQTKKDYTIEQLKDYYRLFSERVESWLNAGHGACVLKDEANAAIIANSLKYFDGEKYNLDEWVVMPNHVHVLVKPIGKHTLSEITHSWKSFSANKINANIGKSGQLWMHESYDHIIRNEDALKAIRNYIRKNPIKAGIVSKASSFGHIVTEASSFGGSILTQSKDALDTKLHHLFSYTDEKPQFTIEEKDKLIDTIDNCKILDPACGSGAFPMGILHKLVFILTKLDPNNRSWKQKQLDKAKRDKALAEQMEDEKNRESTLTEIDKRIEDIEKAFDENNNELDFARKLFLVENCIYGVDIQPVAIQISKLRFFIALIVDQKTENDNEPNRGIRPLPNLETKFVAANTLISIEKPQQLTLVNLDLEESISRKEAEIHIVRDKHFRARTPDTKEKYRIIDKDLRDELASLLEESGYSKDETKKLAHWNPYNQNMNASFFDKDWMFGICDKFDIVIANPPFVEHKKLKQYSQIYKKQFETYSGTADLYVYFYEKGIKLLNPKGVLCFISSNKFIKTTYGEKLREFLTKRRIEQIIDFTDVHVFDALVASCIVLTSEQKPKNEILVSFANDELTNFGNLYEFIAKNQLLIKQNTLGKEIWQLQSDENLDLKAKIENKGTQLFKFKGINFYRGVTTGYNPAFIIDDQKRKELISLNKKNSTVIKPLIQGRNIKKWKINNNKEYLLFIPWHFPLHENPEITGNSIMAENSLRDNYPDLYQHLELHKHGLSQRNKEETGIRYEWYALQRCAASYYKEFDKDKLVWGLTADKWAFAYDDRKHFLPSNGYILTSYTINLKYLLALLNSKLLQFYFSFIGIMTAGGAYTLKHETISEMPIVEGDEKSRQLFIRLVDYILFKYQSEENDIDIVDEFEKVLNGCVFELYFSEEMKNADVDIITWVEKDLDTVKSSTPEDAIMKLYEKWQEPKNEVRNRLILMGTRCPDTIGVIEGSL